MRLLFPAHFWTSVFQEALAVLLCDAALPDTNQPSCSFPQSESSRAVEVFLNFPVPCQASYKDGCRKALHNYSLSLTLFQALCALILFNRHLCQTKAYRCKLICKNMDIMANFCIPEGKFLHFLICTKRCTRENRHLGQKQRQETHRYLVA